MTIDSAHLFTDADVRSLAARLKGLHAQLTPGEQALLHEMLRCAAGSEATDESDVVGFTWAISFNPFAYLDVVVAGLRRDRAEDEGRSVKDERQRRNPLHPSSV